MSFKPMVFVQGAWAGNALRFETEAEALAAANDVFSRWLLCEDRRVDSSTDPVNYRWIEGKGLERLEEEKQ
jgi:hypothetical protein